MKKTIIALLICSVSIFSVAHAGVATITSNTGVAGADTVSVAADEVIEFLGSAHHVSTGSNSGSFGVYITPASGLVYRLAHSNTSTSNGDFTAGQVFAGPITVSVGSQPNGKTMISYRIVSASVYAGKSSSKGIEKAMVKSEDKKDPATAEVKPEVGADTSLTQK